MHKILSILIYFVWPLLIRAQSLNEKELERNQAALKIYKEKEADKKEQLYNEWIQKYPQLEYSNSTVFYDYVRIELSKSFASEIKIKKALEYSDKIQTAYLKPEGWAVTAEEFRKKNHLVEAVRLYTQATEAAYRYKSIDSINTGAAETIRKLPDYSLALSEILFKQDKVPGALYYAKLAHDNSPEIRPDINSHYSEVLIAMKKPEEAFKIAEEQVLAGLADDEMKRKLEQLFISVKGKAGAGEYMKQVKEKLHTAKMKELGSQVINIPAPEFSLNDLDDKLVSLSSLKGKIVILDFWATWCVPCKQSFPFMQELLNKYKERPEIYFLFIHTWEREDNATKKAKEFIRDNNYSFHVLMDLKDPVTKVNNVVRNYKVSALPAKIIIDKQGNIRFFYQKMKGGIESELEDISAIIDLID